MNGTEMMWKSRYPMKSRVVIIALSGKVFLMVKNEYDQELSIAVTQRPPSQAWAPYHTIDSTMRMTMPTYAPYMPSVSLLSSQEPDQSEEDGVKL